jgi:pyruvate kinase
MKKIFKNCGISPINAHRLLLGNSQIKVLAKIENRKGMNNFESILKMADGLNL